MSKCVLIFSGSYCLNLSKSCTSDILALRLDRCRFLHEGELMLTNWGNFSILELPTDFFMRDFFLYLLRGFNITESVCDSMVIIRL
jgi:hypothetical protein